MICIGNKRYRRLKVQFTTKEDLNKYPIRTEPQVVSIRKGEACEFEVFIKPLCSCKIDDEIRLIVLNIDEGEEKQIPVRISAFTMMSTKLDPNELIEDKKLREGSFGVDCLGEIERKQRCD